MKKVVIRVDDVQLIAHYEDNQFVGLTDNKNRKLPHWAHGTSEHIYIRVKRGHKIPRVVTEDMNEFFCEENEDVELLWDKTTEGNETPWPLSKLCHTTEN